MTKLQTWNEAKEILESLGLSKKAYNNALVEFEKLLAPKKGGSNSRPADVVKDGETYRYCRFTNRYWPLSEMVYQNAEKREKLEDKGYSSIGMSLWTKGQRYIKDGMKRATEINFSIIKEYNGLKGDELREYAMNLYKEIEALKAENKGNEAEWLAQFATEEQQKYIAETSIEA